MENSKATDVDGPRADNGAQLDTPARSASQITLTFGRRVSQAAPALRGAQG
jgi:hypothetical protein